eukprot:6486299-Amphidinium_carterae.2
MVLLSLSDRSYLVAARLLVMLLYQRQTAAAAARSAAVATHPLLSGGVQRCNPGCPITKH